MGGLQVSPFPCAQLEVKRSEMITLQDGIEPASISESLVKSRGRVSSPLPQTVK